MRIQQTFDNLKQKQQTAFVAYLCAGDPSYETSLQTMINMPKLGVDIIEVGMPFSDPSGDGPIIEMASKRAIASGMTMQKTLNLVADFRKQNQTTPVVLMTYFNPLLKFGIDKAFTAIKQAGIDGILIVDLPPEEEQEIIEFLPKAQLDLIRLVAPTTSPQRAEIIMQNASGFVYLISLMGITGTKDADPARNIDTLQQLKKITNLPIVVGFGIKTAKQAQAFSKIGADGIVVGSAIVEKMAENNIKEINNFITEIANHINYATKISES
jgi:tryptophan synthase alpha chain